MNSNLTSKINSDGKKRRLFLAVLFTSGYLQRYVEIQKLIEKKMDLSDRSYDYLKKTLCHLKENMLPQNSANMKDFPPEEMWLGVRDELIKAIDIVSNELLKRGKDPKCLDCSIYDL